MDDYQSTFTDRAERIKRAAGASVTSDRARELGIDEHARPDVGEAFAIARTGTYNPPAGEYPHHWATVIMVAGEDRVTLENGSSSLWPVLTMCSASVTLHSWKQRN
jgi:hypothetical protein